MVNQHRRIAKRKDFAHYHYSPGEAVDKNLTIFLFIT
jgi:hypothetical protein